jgi:hypothetical protein
LTRDRRPLVDGTEQASYESALADRMIESPGGLMPADVMRMALDVTGGDYPLATLTAHNLLKELKYSSTAQGERARHLSVGLQTAAALMPKLWEVARRDTTCDPQRRSSPDWPIYDRPTIRCTPRIPLARGTTSSACSLLAA